MSPRRVLCFGTFDGLHVGHQFFLRQAALEGDELHVGVARDAHVRSLKNKHPERPQRVRRDAVESYPIVTKAYLSDEVLGSYEIVKLVQPHMIILGHDQRALEENLVEWMKEEGIYVPTKRLRKYTT